MMKNCLIKLAPKKFLNEIKPFITSLGLDGQNPTCIRRNKSCTNDNLRQNPTDATSK
jgi:hypothetical protein